MSTQPAPRPPAARPSRPGAAATRAAALPAVRDPAKARAAVGRYRVMAWATGTVLLIFTLEIALKYGAGLQGFGWLGAVHGTFYMVYLLTVIDLWSRMRWGFGRLLTMAVAGTVPVMSFVLERRVHADADARLRPAAADPATTLEP